MDFEDEDDWRSGYDRLDDLEAENVSPGSTDRLEFALEQLADADELDSGLDWQSRVWGSVTVEELLGALIEADWLLESYREETGMDYEPELRIPRDD